MVASNQACGIPLQRATQYVAIADMILGLFQFSLLVALLSYSQRVQIPDLPSHRNSDQTQYQYKGPSSFGEKNYGNAPNRQAPRQRTKYTSVLDGIPFGFMLVITICCAIQMVMGVVLYIAALNRHSCTIKFWLIITTLTSLFTGFLLRCFEMFIVVAFVRQLRMEQEVTYFHNNVVANPVVITQGLDPNTGMNTISVQNSGGKIPVPGCTYNAAMGAWIRNGSSSTNPSSGQYGFNGNGFPQQQRQFQLPYDPQNVPAALQPPPQYHEAVKQQPQDYSGNNMGFSYKQASPNPHASYGYNGNGQSTSFLKY